MGYIAAALSALEYSNQSVNQYRTLVAIAATMLRPPPTANERHNPQVLMKLMLETVQEYQRTAEADRALFEVLVLDARNLHRTDMRAAEAIRLLNARRRQSARFQA